MCVHAYKTLCILGEGLVCNKVIPLWLDLGMPIGVLQWALVQSTTKFLEAPLHRTSHLSSVCKDLNTNCVQDFHPISERKAGQECGQLDVEIVCSNPKPG